MMLADESPEVRAAAAQALGSRTDSESHTALRVALSDQDPIVVSAALRSLGQTGAAEFTQAIVPFVRHEDGGVAIEAVRTLCRLIEGPEVELIRKAVEGADPEVLREVLSVVDRWPREQARLILCDALSNDRWDLRVSAVRKLSELSDPEGLRLLAARMPIESDPLVQEALERALRAGLK